MRSSLCFRLILLVSLAPTVAFAVTPERELGIVLPDARPIRTARAAFQALGISFVDGDLGAHTLSHVDERIRFDPSSGAVTSTLTLSLVSGPSGFAQTLLLFDAGLQVRRVQSTFGDGFVQGQVAGEFYYAAVGPQFAIGPETPFDLTVVIEGVLACPVQGGLSSCDRSGSRVDFALSGSLFPYLYDPLAEEWGRYYEREISLSMPDGNASYLAAEHVETSVEQGWVTNSWKIPVYNGIGAIVAVFGNLVEREVVGASVPVRIVHRAEDDVWVSEIESWSVKIMDFIDDQVGQPMTYPVVTFVKLPTNSLFPGTAGHSMTLLSEVYGLQSARYFEETFAHETSHIWWGSLTRSLEDNTRFLTEGLATFSQIDYTGRVIYPERDFEGYLAQRYNEMRNYSLYGVPFASLPPVVLPPGVQMEGRNYTAWAYLKGASILDLLRVTIGEDSFTQGLQDYVAICRDARCPATAFQSAMEGATGADLGWFFSQYVYGSEVAALEIGFTQAPIDEGSAVSISLGQSGSLQNDVELWLELDDQSVQRVRQFVSEPNTVVQIVTPTPVRRVRPNPRYETMISFSTANEHDVDFDGEVDGSDVLHCAFRVGEVVQFNREIGEGVTTFSTRFDARCDRDGDGTITEGDIASLWDHFGELLP